VQEVVLLVLHAGTISQVIAQKLNRFIHSINFSTLLFYWSLQ